MPNATQRLLVLANWKMNLSIDESVTLARALTRAVARAKPAFDLGLCPTFPALPGVAKVLAKTKVALGAQDIFWKPVGPFTGEVSPTVLHELGVAYVLVGHSERRQYQKETDAMVHQKVQAALAAGLAPVLCVGETFAERQSGQKDVVVARQVHSALQGVALPHGQNLVVAYEPVWVIGSGQAVAPEEARDTARLIRQSLLDTFSAEVVSKQVHIIYGGSVDPTNIATFVQQSPLAGVLVGGASLEAKRFLALLRQL